MFERDIFMTMWAANRESNDKKVQQNQEKARKRKKKTYQWRKAKGVKKFTLTPNMKVLKLNNRKNSRMGGATEAL